MAQEYSVLRQPGIWLLELETCLLGQRPLCPAARQELGSSSGHLVLSRDRPNAPSLINIDRAAKLPIVEVSYGSGETIYRRQS
jgi:hypothetical protein